MRAVSLPLPMLRGYSMIQGMHTWKIKEFRWSHKDDL